MAARTQFLLIAFTLLSVIVILYYPALHYNFIGLDDYELIVRNPDIKIFALDRLWHLLTRPYITLYVPVTMLSYVIDYQLWHLTSFGFRFTNVLIHFFNSVLIFYLVRLIQKKLYLAFAAAFVFAIHPVQIESVIWISERKNVLSTFFLLFSLIFYWKGVVLNAAKQNKYLGGALIFFVLGLLSKPSAVIFIPLIFWIHSCFGNESSHFRKHLWFYITCILCTGLVTGATIFGTANDVEHYTFHGGHYLTNLFVMMTVFWKYWLLLLFPYHQNILYLSPIYRSFLDLPVLFSALGLLLLSGAGWMMYVRNRMAAFWLGWFLISFLPVSNLIAPLPSIMNDRYLYVPIVGFFACLFNLLERSSFGFRRAATLCSVFFLAVPYLILTAQRIPEWKTGELLWQSALRRSPREDPRIYYFYGINQLDEGQYERSIELFKKSLSLYVSSDTLLALGTACVAADRLEEAETYLKQVIERDPKRAGAYDQLAVVYRKGKHYQEAQSFYKKAIQLQPRNAVLYNNYALFFMDIGEPEKAHEIWMDALQLDPDCHFALRNLVWYYVMREQWEEAADYLIRFLKRNPNDPQIQSLIPVIEKHLSPQEPTGISA